MITEYMMQRAALKCSVCQYEGAPVVKRVGSNLGAYCSVCASYIKWVKQDQFWLAYERAMKHAH